MRKEASMRFPELGKPVRIEFVIKSLIGPQGYRN